jgi:hypothetical protein
MTTVHTHHHITGDDLVAIVAPFLRPVDVAQGRPFTEFHTMSRGEIVDLVRSELHRYGADGHWSWRDQFPDPDEVDARKEFATNLIANRGQKPTSTSTTEQAGGCRPYHTSVVWVS